MNLRELFIAWLTDSQLVRELQNHLIEQRQDFTLRLDEKDTQIKQLRTENAGLKLECDRMRSVLMPYGSPAGAVYSQRFDVPAKPVIVPAFNGPDDWSAELNRMYQEEKPDGAHGNRREEVHESSADDGSQ